MDKRNLLKTAAGMIFVLSISRVIGFFRQMLVAYRFGSGAMTDAFFIANSINDTIYIAFAAGLSSAIIPVLSKIKKNDRLEKQNEYISGLLNIFAVISIIMICLGFIYTNQLVKIFAMGFSGEKLKMAVDLTRIGMPVIFFHAASAILITYNHSLGKFVMPSLESIFFNMPIIVYLVFFYSEWGIKGLMAGFVVGYVLRVFIIWLPLMREFKYKPVLFSQKDNLINMTSIMFPIMIGSMVGRINRIVDRTLASNLVEGSISALSYSAKTKEIVISLFIASIVTVVYPKISDYIAIGEKEKLQKTMTYSMNLILIMVMPALVILLILNYEIIKVLFYRGAFTKADLLMTSSALKYYSLGLIGTGVNLLVDKVYYASNDAKTPMRVAIIAVGINIILNLILIGPMKHNGLALATSISVIFAAIVKFLGLKKKNIAVEYRKMCMVFLKVLISSGIMGVLVFILAHFFINITSGEATWQFIKLVGVCGAGAIAYALMLYSFKVEEFLEIMRHLAKKT